MDGGPKHAHGVFDSRCSGDVNANSNIDIHTDVNANSNIDIHTDVNTNTYPNIDAYLDINANSNAHATGKSASSHNLDLCRQSASTNLWISGSYGRERQNIRHGRIGVGMCPSECGAGI